VGRLLIFLVSSLTLTVAYIVGFQAVAPSLKSVGLLRDLDRNYFFELVLVLYWFVPMILMVGLAYALGIWRSERHLLIKGVAAIWCMIVTYWCPLGAFYIGCFVYKSCL